MDLVVAALGFGHRALCCGEHFGGVDRKDAEIDVGAEQENTAVPDMVAAGDHFGGSCGVGLFDEAGDRMDAFGLDIAELDIAIAGFGAGRGDAIGR